MDTFKLKDNILELVCRTCLKLNKVRFNLFKHSQNNRLVSDMLMECFSLTIHKDDGLPVNICSNCLEKLSSACDFKAMVMQSDAKLHNFYQNKILESEKDPLANVGSIYIKEEGTALKLEQDEHLFHLSENMNDENVTQGSLIKEENINSALLNQQCKQDLHNISSFYAKEESILKSEGVNRISDLTEEINLKRIHDNLQEKPYVNNNIECSISIISKEESKSIDDDCISTNTQFPSLVIQLTPGSSNNCENHCAIPAERPCIRNFIEEDEITTNESINFFDDSNPLALNSDSSEKSKKKQKGNRSKKQNNILDTNNVLFKCDKCNKSFGRQYILKQHMRVHLETKEFSCDICGKTFRTLHGAQIHKSTHSDERPHKCNVCDKTFKYIDTLKQHQLIHKNDKKFVCELCDKSFINSSGLIHHRATHNKEKRFVCTVCEKCFKSQRLLSDHLRRHSDTKPYMCQYCDGRFKCRTVLKSHILIHTGAKPFSCKICDKKFRQRPTLRYHMRIHTGETPYECELCSSKFKYKQHLSNHMKIHNNELQN